jgi:dipeptide/tripeptide permease
VSPHRQAGPGFPSVFWAANGTELLERAAYYSIASLLVLYLGQVGLGNYLPSLLSGLLWYLVYFLPILSGSIADQIGFRRALLMAFLVLVGGYFLMGYPVWFGGAVVNPRAGDPVTASLSTLLALSGGILLIGIGGSFVKPCISGTVQKVSAGRATLAFGIFYMVINIGSILGRLTSWTLRRRLGMPSIFAVAMGCALLAFLLVLLTYRDPDGVSGAQRASRPRKPVRLILADLILVVRNRRFALYLLVSTGFLFIYSQVYNLLPLYLRRTVDLDPPADLITLANPVVIVAFQLVVTRFFGKLEPIKSMVIGALIVGVAMGINLVPLFLAGGPASPLFGRLAVGTCFIVMTVGLIAFGELFSSARNYEYIGAMAPKGQEGLFLGFSGIPQAFAFLAGGPAGALLLNKVMLKHATLLPNGLLKVDVRQAALGWIFLMLLGFASAGCLWAYHAWLKRQGA